MDNKHKDAWRRYRRRDDALRRKAVDQGANQPKDSEYKNARRRYRRRLAKQLVLQAERVCESLDKEPKVAQEVLDRMMKAIFELRVDERSTVERSSDFVEHLRDCAKGAPYVELDEETPNTLVLEGIFDLGKLSKRVFWYGHREIIKEELQEIHQCL